MGTILSAIVSGGIVATIISVGFGLWNNSRALKTQRVTILIDEVVQEIRDLETSSREYWRLPGTDAYAEVLAAEIVTRVHRVSSLVGNLADEAWVFEGHDVGEPVDALHLATTGGQFQVASRAVDLAAATAVSYAVTDLVVALRMAQRNS